VEVPADVQSLVTERLACLGRGFGALEESGSALGVRFQGSAEIRLPPHVRSVFLRLRVLGQSTFHGTLHFHDEHWRSLGVRALSGEEALLVVEIQEPLLRVTLPPGVSALLLDLDYYSHPVRATHDMAGLRARGRRFLTLRVDLTNKCNLRCRMCQLSFDEVFFQQKDYIQVEEFERMAAEVFPLTAHLALSAGFEPLLHPGFSAVLARVQAAEIPFVELTTNGTLLTPAVMQALVDARVNAVIMSVDGARPETYEYIRRGADFSRFIRSLRIFTDVQRASGSAYPALVFNMVLMRHNIDELEEVLRLGARFGLRRMNTVLMVPHVGLEMEHQLLQFDRERANLSFARARKAALELGIEAQIPPDFDLSLPQPDVERVPGFEGMTLCRDWDRKGTAEAVELPAEVVALNSDTAVACHAPQSDEQPWHPPDQDGATAIAAGSAAQGRSPRDADDIEARTACSYPWTMAVLRPDRAVVPCCQWVDHEVMGDLKQQSFEEIWNGPAYQRLRIELQTRRFRPACLHCPERQRI
jgi:radical SAM protein with 4Fe4S-binding SPASM domain